MTHFAERPIAIVGLSCRLPGADDLDEFWRLLRDGRTELGELPPERFDRELQYSPEPYRTKSYTSLGGVIRPRPFDEVACPISAELRESSHKAHLTLLEVAAAACRHAGYDPFALPERRCGVYVGHTPPSAHVGDVIYAREIAHTVEYLREVPGFAELPADQQAEILAEIVAVTRAKVEADPRAVNLSANASHGAALITEAFQLDGPSMAFDAACASSMRALGHGIRSLQRGAIEMAIVGGASYCQGDTLVLFSQAQSVSRQGSRPFDDDADGLVAAEGYVILVLKTLERALADGDPIQAIIRGVGISSDGKGKSLWAPRKEGQIEAIRRAYGAHARLEDLQYMEMHATSTQVGDATELAALTEVFRDRVRTGSKLPIGSVKANVGHTLETAGLASLAKTVLAMQNGFVPPQINIQKLNTSVDWNELPFFVPQDGLEWPRPGENLPRHAAVNAFGIGGLNVHIALEEHIPGVTQVAPFFAPADPAKSQPIGLGDDDHAIAIVGRGAVLPGARTIDGLWEMFQSGQDQRTAVPPERWDSRIGYEPGSDRLWSVPIDVGGFIRDYVYDWKKHKVPPKQVASADPLQFMLLDAADQAFRDSGYHERPFDKLRTGVMVGTIFGGEFGDQLQMGLKLPEFQRQLAETLGRRGVPADRIAQVARDYEDALLKRMPALIDETGSFTASTLASRITKTFDLMGGAVALDGSEASGFAAIDACIDMLLAGDVDMMVCAAGQRAMDFARFEAMARRGMLARNAPLGPFDADSDGGVLGEGVGVILLKRLADARRDGDVIHGVIRGIGVARDESLATSVRTAIARAMQSAGVTPDQISVLEAGSYGDPSFDREEVRALAESYGTGTRTQPLLIGALAAQIGNTGGVSSMAALLKAGSELAQVEMPRNVGRQNLPELAARAPEFLPADQGYLIPGLNPDGKLLAGISSYTQSKIAYHLILEGPTKVPCEAAAVAPPEASPAVVVESESAPQPVVAAAATVVAEPAPAAVAAAATDWRIVRVGATTFAELQQRVAALAEESASAFESAPATAFASHDRHRAAFVVSTADELAQKATLAAKQMHRPEARVLLAEQGTFVGSLGTSKPRVAFLFPGQGSQYSGMLKTLVETYPPAAEAVREVDAVFASLKLPTFAQLAWNDEDQLGKNVWWTQMSLLAADAVMLRCMESLGIVPDRVAGHSFGELVALLCAGSWSFDQAVQATTARCVAIGVCRNAAGVMLSTSAPPDELERHCRDAGGRVFVSHRNSPDQTVAGGDPDAVARLDALVQQAGHRTKRLDVPAAFHTPLMDEVREPFAVGLLPIAIEPPRTPVLSSVTARYVADPHDIRDNLVVQMTQPVPWIDVIRRFASEGVRVFVEVGPKSVLTGLNKSILQAELAAESPVSIVACDHPKRPGLQQLLAARACVEVAGALDAEFPTARLAPVVAAAAPVVATDAESNADAPAIETYVVDHALHNELQILRLSGTPWEMGFQHGRERSEAIRRVLRRYADLAGSKWDGLHDLDALVDRADVFFGPDELEELKGIAKGANVTLEGLIAHNIRLFLDAGAGGIHFAVTASANPAEGLLHAVNEDLQHAICLRDCLERLVQVRLPNGAFPHLVFTVPGQVGGLNGMNACGLAVSSTALADVAEEATVFDRQLHTVLVKRLLERAETLEQAIDLIRETKSATPFSLCLSDHLTDRLAYVEYDGKRLKVLPTPPAVFAANHRQMETHSKSLPGRVPVASQQRLDRLKTLLGGDRPQDVTVEKVQEALRDRFDSRRGRDADVPTTHTVRRVDNQISVVMQPARGEVWITPGPLANGHQNEFKRLTVADLLPRPESLRQDLAAHDDSASVATNVPASCVAPETLQAALAASEAAAHAADPKPVCSRFAMRVVAANPASPAGELPTLGGLAVILGDNPASRALQTRLAELGTSAYLIAASDDVDGTLAAFDSVAALGPVPHLFLMTPHDVDAVTSLDAAAWDQRRTRGALLPYLVCQRWFQAALAAKCLDQATLVATTRLGGDFGFSGRIGNVESGGLVGLVKGVQLENEMTGTQKGLRSKVVDFAADVEPAQVVESVVRELAAKDAEVEVGYVDGARYVVRPLVDAAANHPTVEISHGATFVVTGGARGVTAVVARELGLRFGLKLHLIGSSPIPEIPEAYHDLGEDELKELKAGVMKEALADGVKPIDAWARYEKALEIDRTLRSLRAEGVQATYHACDVSDRVALAAVLDAVRAQDGPISGIVHGAGFERATRFEKKQRDLVAKTIAAKVDGAAALLDLTRDDPVRYFAAFGSVSGRFGGVGQTDYCLANEMLTKLAGWIRGERPGLGATAFHWHAWDDVGMAVRPESQHIRKLHDIRFMPSREGAGHLVAELAAGMPEGEVVITETKYYGDRYFPGGVAAGPVAAHGPVAGTSNGTIAHRNGSAPHPGQPAEIADRPLLDALTEFVPAQSATVELHLHPVRDPFLAQHRYKGRPLLPVVIGMESLTEAAAVLLQPGERIVGLRNVEIVNGLKFMTDDPQTARVRAVRDGNEVRCELTADFLNRKGVTLQTDKPYLRAVVEIGDGSESRETDWLELPTVWHDCWYPEEDTVIYHGMPFRRLRKMAFREEQMAGFGQLLAPSPSELAGSRRGSGWIMPPALLDACFFASGICLWVLFKGVVSIPNGIRRIRLGRAARPNEECVVQIRYRGREGDLGLFDLDVRGDDGDVVLQVEGYQNVIVAEEPANAV